VLVGLAGSQSMSNKDLLEASSFVNKPLANDLIVFVAGPRNSGFIGFRLI
jgi:hypothetical protein